MKRYFIIALIVLLGLFYLFSGIIKIIDIDEFLYLIRHYQIKSFIYVAPVIPIIEILVGLFLFLRIKLKKTILFSIFLLVGFTLVFSYGHFFYHIDNCGCFGGVDFLKMSPFMFYLRNCFLLFLSYYLYSSVLEDNKPIKYYKWIAVSFVIILFILTLWNRMQFEKYIKETPYTRETIHEYHDRFIHKNVNETIFNNYIRTSKDSSYLLFIFSFDCPHCMASTIYLNSYTDNKVADKILAIVNGSRAEERFFKENFPINFNYKKIEHIDMRQITGFHPLSFYIKNDTIQFKIKGALPKYDEFESKYLNK